MSIIDMGANVGVFSRIASDKGIETISFDIDPAAVERNYLQCRKNNEQNLLPLLLDLTNPSPSIGWNNEERDSLLQRCLCDTVLALALIHHLAISNNLPLIKIARFFSDIFRWLIIEFVPKTDSQVQRLISTREDIFADYKKEVFEKEFRSCFEIERIEQIKNTDRTLYLMHRKGS